MRFINQLLNLIPVLKNKTPSPPIKKLPRTVAHALGEWNGQSYLNCLEAFKAHYAQGVRCFEVDLHQTSDGEIVLFHDGHEKRLGLPASFTLKDFVNAHPFGATLLSLDGFAQLLKQYPDITIITDVKDHNILILSRIKETFLKHQLDYASLVVPQLYHPSEFIPAQRLGFKYFIFTVYRFRNLKNLTARLLLKYPEIIALTVPDKWILSKNYIDLHSRYGFPVFVHPIQDPQRRDELYAKGVYGIYTSNLF